MVALVSLACGSSEANEARLFLDRYDTLDEAGEGPRPDPAPRHFRARLEALARSSFESERVIEAQQRCVAMHEAVIRADDARAEATRLIAEIERASPDARGAIPREPIEAALAASAAAVDEARRLRPECDEAVRALRSRFGAARGR